MALKLRRRAGLTRLSTSIGRSAGAGSAETSSSRIIALEVRACGRLYGGRERHERAVALLADTLRPSRQC